MPGNEFRDDFNESTSPVHQSSPLVQSSDCRPPFTSYSCENVTADLSQQGYSRYTSSPQIVYCGVDDAAVSLDQPVSDEKPPHVGWESINTAKRRFPNCLEVLIVS